jgi:hypothetical protein
VSVDELPYKLSNCPEYIPWCFILIFSPLNLDTCESSCDNQFSCVHYDVNNSTVSLKTYKSTYKNVSLFVEALIRHNLNPGVS